MRAPVIARERSENSKLGRVSATYVSQATCPTGCPLLDSGCYAQSGVMNLHTTRLNDADETNPHTVARIEADAIRSLTGRLPLRLHVVGDCPDAESAATVAAAAREHTAKAGQPAWGYTHAWRDVPAVAWAGVSMLASCELPSDIGQAEARGFATAIVYTGEPKVKAFTLCDETTGAEYRVVPCPAQVRHTTCADCCLCLNADNLRRHHVTIGLAAHGAQRAKIAGAIERRQEKGA